MLIWIIDLLTLLGLSQKGYSKNVTRNSVFDDTEA